MIVCHCTGTTDSNIVDLIRDGASSVREIAQRSGAGRCCGPCQDEIEDILSRTLRARAD